MKNWEEDDDPTYCSAAEDLAIANESCETMGIPLQTVNFSHEYWERVFAIFLEEYRKGRTPNPDVLCNREIKFREFLDFATELGAEFIATGHYARTRKHGSLTQLLKGADPEKDQSYFLHQVPQAALAHTLFPVGDLKKKEVRIRAHTLGLPNSDRKDSTGICFIGERRFKDFLARYLPPNPGEIRTLDGRMIGEHDGLWFYTLGQRHGLDIGGPGKAWYVAKKDMSRNILHVVQGHDDPGVDAMDHSGFRAPLDCRTQTRFCAHQMRSQNSVPPERSALSFVVPEQSFNRCSVRSCATRNDPWSVGSALRWRDCPRRRYDLRVG